MSERLKGVIVMIGGLWVKVPCKLLNDERVTKADMKVFAYMADRLKTTSKTIPIAKIAEKCELSERTVIRSVKALEEYGYIRADREQGRATVYTQLLLPATEPKKKPKTRQEAPQDGFEAEKYAIFVNDFDNLTAKKEAE